MMDRRHILTHLLGGALALTSSACGDGKIVLSTATTNTSTTTTTTDNSSASTTSPSGTSTTIGETSGTAGTSGTTWTTSSTGGTDSDTGCGFLDCSSSGGEAPSCDMWVQDCPEGHKCAPYSSDGGYYWNANKCVPVDPDPDGVGEACTVEINGVSGLDSCGPASMCWDVDPETLEGSCVAFCAGSAEEPICDPGTSCAIASEGVLILCLDTCDPLLGDCPRGHSCLPSGQAFRCVPDASGPDGGAYSDPCEYANGCDPGLVCMNAEYVDGCEAVGCCSPWCDVEAEDECPGETQECIPWYEEGAAPPGYENVGVCGIPQ